MSWLIDPAQRLLVGALDGLSRRQSLISANLANIDTPGYRPSSLDFESVLRAQLRDGAPGAMASSAGAPPAATAMQRTDPRHLDPRSVSGLPSAARRFDGTIRNDGNTVDLESEMTALTETQLRYAAVNRLVGGKLGMLNDAIGRGR